MSLKSILIVDDEPSIRKIFSHFLGKEIERVDLAEDGLIGLQMAKNYEYDLIISDISMPNMDGMEFFEQLRKQGIKTDFVFITAYDDKEKEIQALGLPYQGFNVKPINRSALLSLIEPFHTKYKAMP